MAGRLRRIGDRVEVAFGEVEDFLDSPAGRRLRRLLAAGAIVGAPMLFRIPGLRRYPLLRTLELVGGAALIVKFTEALRDWEPSARRAVVIDVPAAPPPRPQATRQQAEHVAATRRSLMGRTQR